MEWTPRCQNSELMPSSHFTEVLHFKFESANYLIFFGQNMNYREFRTRFRLIPFGKFSMSGRGEAPYNQIYVGRKKERASFIELLTHQEQFGSFLVSGRRGSGKTSFVSYTLDEYEQSSFHRFIRFARNSGIQDIFVALLICLLISTMFVLIGQIGELLAQNAHLSLRRDFPVFDRLVWVWIPLILLAALAIGLVLYALQGINAAAGIYQGRWRKIIFWFLGLVFCGLLFAVLVINVPTLVAKSGFSGFAGGLNACLLALLAVAIVNNVFIIIKIEKTLIVRFRHVQTLVAFVYFCLLILILLTNDTKYIYTKIDDVSMLYYPVVFSIVMYSNYLISSIKNESNRNEIDSPGTEGPLFILIGLLLIVLPLVFWFFWESGVLFIIATLLPVFGAVFRLLFWRRNGQSGDPGKSKKIYFNRPPVELVLIIKSAFALILVVAFISPPFQMLLVHFRPDSDFATGPGLSLMFHLKDWDIIPIAFFLSMLFFYEYEWISRSMRTERQDSSIAPLGRRDDHAQLHELWPDQERTGGDDKPDWADYGDKNPLHIPQAGNENPWLQRRSIARKLEKASLPYLFYSSRVPVIFTWINLGFDDLRHSRIIEAMLVQLRAQYREKFTSLSSQIGMATTVATVITVLVLTKLFASTLFHVGPVNQLKDPTITESRTGAVSTLGATNYCGFFERNPEVAPVVKNAICLLPYSDHLFELIYSRVLDLSVDFDVVSSNVPPVPSGKTQEKTTGLWVGSFGEDETNNCSDDKPKFCTQSLKDSILFKFVLDRNLGLPLIRAKQGILPGIETLEAYHPQKEADGDSTSKNEGLPTLRVYHFLLFFMIYLVLRIINKSLQVVPYQDRAAEMTRLIALIRGRITYTKSDMPGAGWIQQLLGFRRRDETIETTPDPRIVEQSFIELLQRVANCDRGGNWRFWTWLEAKPEIVFIFDEMDKQSGKIDAEVSRTDEAASTIEENTRERQRSLQLHQLLSDMKRLISSDAARFIFIGGRLYHDEWLADQANRAPLLSSIFNGQIYLPSLLTDREHAYSRFNDRIAEFFLLIFRNAKHRFEYWRRLRNLPIFFGSRNLDEPTYIQSTLPYSGHSRRLAAMAYHVSLHIYDESGDRYDFNDALSRSQSTPLSLNPPAQKAGEKQPNVEKRVLRLGEQETLEQLLNFLTYRSAGNPKKLKEMLQSLVLPSSKAFKLPRYSTAEQHNVRWEKLLSHHDVIVLDDKTIYRIQFVDVLYRHLTDHLESRMLERDDKVSMSLFYLMDFLLKFHNRGFSWTNLQRVDELSHIHRSPDLRSMMGVLVDVSSERFLHRVLNGVYSFRFRSDFAREIDYLSRVSKEEMAALNFTLDESQNLKGLYQQTLSTGQRENVDTISGLGELYEYDQEFEIARNYYRRAISVLDAALRESTGTRFSASGKKGKSIRKRRRGSRRTNDHTIDQPGEAEWLPLGFVQLTTADNEAAPLIKSNYSWAIARLRLMLQIGHTYEQERNYERALGSYMHSHRFSQAILRATIATVKVTAKPTEYLEQERTVTGENYSILYQAGMAAAWIFEKDNQDLDDSINHAEHAVGWLYSNNTILFRSHWKHLLNTRAQYAPDNSSMMLVAGDMHNRVGNLYFFKGKQSLRGIRNFESYTRPGNPYSEKPGAKNDESLNFGYLLQSHYHYSMSIWNIRNYLSLRQKTSAYRLNILRYKGKGKKPQATLRSDGPLPDFMYNSLSNTITDMSEAVLARISIGAMLNGFLDVPPPVKCKTKEDVASAIIGFGNRLGRSTKEFSQRLPMIKMDGSSPDDELDNFPLFTCGESTDRCHLYHYQFHANDAFLWLGNPGIWPKNKKKYAKKRTLKFNSKTGLVDDRKRLNAYIYFSTVAADNLKLGGYSVDAANEYLLQAETAVSILWSMRQAVCLHDKGTKESADLIRTMLEAGTGESVLDLNRNSFDTAQCILGTLAARALEKAANLIQLSYRPSTSHSGQNHGEPNKIKKEIVSELRKIIEDLGKGTIGLKAVVSKIALDIDYAEAREIMKKHNNLKEYLVAHPDNAELIRNGYGRVTASSSFKNYAARYRNLKARYENFLTGNKSDTTEHEMHDDYHMSQAWRDDPRLLSLAASLVLALAGDESNKDVAKNRRVNVAIYVYDGFLQNHGAGLFKEREDNDKWCNADTAYAYSGLFKLCERHRYPVLNRLNSIKRLLDAAVIHGLNVVEVPNTVKIAERDKWADAEHAAIIGRLCNELTATAGIYDSDMHFSPYQHGTSLALAYFYCIHNGYWALYDTETGNEDLNKKVRDFQVSKSDRDWDRKPSLSAVLITRESLGELSLNLLRRSEQLFSMGGSYYESIERMQYLNDDFNDRSIHYNHAKRMMFAEMAHVLAASVHHELYKKPGMPI